MPTNPPPSTTPAAAAQTSLRAQDEPSGCISCMPRARSGQNVRSRFSAIKNLAYDHKRRTFQDCTCVHRSVAIFASLPEAFATSVEKTSAVFANPVTASVSLRVVTEASLENRIRCFGGPAPKQFGGDPAALMTTTPTPF